MNIVLWIIQVVLGGMFLMAGTMKILRSKEQLATNMAWVNDFSQNTVRGIGILEVLGAIGLLLPAITGIMTWLTPLAAAGLVLTMIGAALTHARRGEYPMIGMNMVLLLLAAFVVYGRWILAPL